MNYIRINADDFGLTKAVNRGIMQAFNAGVLSSVSLMVNGRAFEHAVKLARCQTDFQVGLHIVLVEENPVSAPEMIPSLIGGSGRLCQNHFDFLIKYLSGRIVASDVRHELERQFEAFVATGLTVAHVDSHCHLHVLPAIFEMTAELSVKYGARYIRLPRRPLSFSDLTGGNRFFLQFILNIFSGLCKIKMKASGLETADAFSGFSCSGKLTFERLIKFMQADPLKRIEIGCHPGQADSLTNRYYGHWGYNWQQELDSLLRLASLPDLKQRIMRP